MTYGRSFGRPGFLGPEPLRLTTRFFGERSGPAMWPVADAPYRNGWPPHSHTVPGGAWSAQFACPLCGGPREEVIGRIE